MANNEQKPGFTPNPLYSAPMHDPLFPTVKSENFQFGATTTIQNAQPGVTTSHQNSASPYPSNPTGYIGDPFPNYESSTMFEPSTNIDRGAPYDMPGETLYMNPQHYESPLHSASEGLIKTADHEPHVILAKKFRLLFFILIIMVIAGIGTAVWAFYESKFGQPPTEFSQTAYSNTLYALLSLFTVSLCSIIILRGKIHNLAIGYLIMFMYILTLYFALKGASRAYISIKYDDIVTIEKYVFAKNDRSRGELPQFFHRIQISFECCGTSSVDKMEDWPVRLNTKDLPRSCCKKMTSTCGKLLARTFEDSGEPHKPMRTPSGYFLTLSENELDEIVNTGKPVKIVRAPGKEHGSDIVLKVIKDFYFKELIRGYPPDTPIDDMKRIPNDIIEPFDVGKDNLPIAIGCSDDTALEKVTIIGWGMQRMLDYETSVVHARSAHETYDWIAWRIPMCREIGGEPPFHLASNFKREIASLRADVKHMWYISKGITENYLLKDLIWEKFCENGENLQFAPDIPLVSWINDRPREERTTTAIGKFFIAFVHKLMVFCFVLSTLVVILLLVVFLIFWKYYSRMKLEEYANLPYPPEFDILKVHQSDLYVKHGKDEYDKEKSKLLKEKDELQLQQSEGSLVDYEGIKEEFDRMFASPRPPAGNVQHELQAFPERFP